MGFFSSIKSLFGAGDEPAEIAELAEELDRYADRYENADDDDNAALARDYARRIRKCMALRQAKDLHREFLAIVKKHEDTGVREHYRERDTDREWSDDS